MDSKLRAQLIREANTAFNDKDIRKARELYLKTDYKDGLVRLGDYFMYDRKLPMLAFGYYKKAGMQSKVDEIFQRMIFALSTWIGRDKFKPASASNDARPAANNIEPLSDEKSKQSTLNPDDFRVHPILRAKALEILAQQNR
ncbi:hypothetical protein [Leptospira sp. GIMC2001]|uniref:hypothetical protein n=1 Tax=Leptospira sp. GIMC2001 TaxID=1513297 RepID=UPI00234A05D7|nr:hypothetical protein [Leptospira sp. GIMC2001]WCL50188.1 hypothetical protein O4O04_05045 [Leptospira sp. GIMC2001]